MIYESIDQRLPYPNNLSTFAEGPCRHTLLGCNVKNLKDLQGFARKTVLGDSMTKEWTQVYQQEKYLLLCNPSAFIENRNNMTWQISCYLGKTLADFDTSKTFKFDFDDSPVHGWAQGVLLCRQVSGYWSVIPV